MCLNIVQTTHSKHDADNSITYAQRKSARLLHKHRWCQERKLRMRMTRSRKSSRVTMGTPRQESRLDCCLSLACKALEHLWVGGNRCVVDTHDAPHAVDAVCMFSPVAVFLGYYTQQQSVQIQALHFPASKQQGSRVPCSGVRGAF